MEDDEIMSLVEQLPQSYQKVFRLSVLEGLSHQDIARILHIDPHTSSADLFRAKMMLRRSLLPLPEAAPTLPTTGSLRFAEALP